MIASRKRLLLALCVTACLGGVLVLAAGALAALPALLAFVPLLAGRYLGASRLERAIDARRPRRAVRPASALWPPALARCSFVPRGGRLIADSLAKRPPPPASVPA